MPKLTKDFPAQLSLQVPEDTRIYLIAIGYLSGNGGEYGPPARNILHRGIKDYVEQLDARTRKEFDEILSNVRICETHKLTSVRIRETQKLPGEENQKAPVV